MAATRQRRSSSDLPAERKKTLPQTVPSSVEPALHRGSDTPSDGWQVPGRVARRSLRKAGKTSASGSGVLDRSNDGVLKATVKQAVPAAVKLKAQRAGFTEHPRAELHSLSSDSIHSKTQQTANLNPFALLGKDLMLDGFGASRDANPGSSKRARPVESLTRRTVSKTEKRNAKVAASSTSASRDKAVLSDSPTHNLGTVVSAGLSDPTTCIQDSVTKGLLPQSTLIESRCHESVVSCLKAVIRRQCSDSLLSAVSPRVNQAVDVIDAPVEDNQLMDCNSQKEEGGTLSLGYLSDSVMLEDQAGAPPPPAN